MRIGVMVDMNRGLDESVAAVRAAVDAGAASVWSAQVFGIDALTMLAVAGREVPTVELGTAVVPIQPRHPLMLAAQALTTQSAVGNRLTLGIGLSHQPVVEGLWGLPFDRPAQRMREYLDVLLPALRGETVDASGELYTGRTLGPLTIPGAEPPEVLLAALGPRMLELAGGTTGGTITWMTGRATIADHIVPSITKAADGAGRPQPRVVVGLPVLVGDPDAARERAARDWAVYGTLPSYRAMLDREGAAGPADVAVVGDEDAVAAQIARIADAGATDFLAAPYGSREDRQRTMALVADLARA